MKSKSEIGPKPIKTERRKKVVDEPAQKPVVSAEGKRTRSARWYHRQRAHVPGPRRRRKFESRPETPVVAEEETVAEASAEAEVSDEGSKPKRSSKRDMTGRERPMTLGSIDG